MSKYAHVIMHESRPYAQKLSLTHHNQKPLPDTESKHAAQMHTRAATPAEGQIIRNHHAITADSSSGAHRGTLTLRRVNLVLLEKT